MKPVKNKRGKYEVRWRIRQGTKEVRHKRTFDLRKDAVDFIENLSAERQKDHVAAKRTFNDYADRYIAAARTRVKPRTVEHYEGTLKVAREFLGTRAVGTLRATDADAYLAELTNRMKGKRLTSLRACWRTFAAVLDLAVRDEALPSNPARKVDLPTAHSRGESKFKAAFLTEAQVARLAGHLAEREPYDLLVEFAAYTGLRRGEIAALNIGDVRVWLHAGTWRGKVAVRQSARYVANKDNEPIDNWRFDTPKTESSVRDVPLSPDLAERMHDYIGAHPHNSDPAHPLWPGRRRGGHTHGEQNTDAAPGQVAWDTRWEPESFCRNVFAPAVKRAKLGHVRFHDLRHTFASICSANGVPVERVSAWMGHSSIVITWTTYTHLFRGDDDHDEIAKLGSLNHGTVRSVGGGGVGPA
jgi:integrase